MSVRLSPAANLLRNSKLFALPPTIPLPAIPPSSEEVSRSDSATAVYPQHAALQTPHFSRARGDWGFKRPLPSKLARSTNHATVRLVRGIDTPEHVADFESAADHVLTLEKFLDLNQPISLLHGPNSSDRRQFSAFHPALDNTTNTTSTAPAEAAAPNIWPNVSPDEVKANLPSKIASTQEELMEKVRAGIADPAKMQAKTSATSTKTVQARRWKYAGPSLIQLSGMEFDAYLNTLGEKQQVEMKERIKQDLVRQRLQLAREAGEMEAATTTAHQVTEEDLANHLRFLRHEPSRFGPIIADLLDLPETSHPARTRDSKPWEYGRDTLASIRWHKTGPPMTHPSAGLSYANTELVANNDPKSGPQKKATAVVARAVKKRSRSNNTDTTYGVAGFIVPQPTDFSSLYGNRGGESFKPTPGGQKAALTPLKASVTVEGAVEITTEHANNMHVVDDRVVDQREYAAIYDRQVREANRRQALQAPQMSNVQGRIGQAPAKKAEEPKPTENVDELMKQLKDLAMQRGRERIAREQAGQ